MAKKSPWGQEPDKDDRPSYLSEPNANSPVDPTGPTSRKAAFHSADGKDFAGGSVHAGWRVPLEGTDPRDGLDECLVAQSFSSANPRAYPGSAGNERPDFVFPNQGQDFVVKVGEFFSLTVQAVDVENDSPLDINRIDTVSWLSYVDNGNGTGTYSGTPSAPDVGDHTLNYEADDQITTPTGGSFQVEVVPA